MGNDDCDFATCPIIHNPTLTGEGTAFRNDVRPRRSQNRTTPSLPITARSWSCICEGAITLAKLRANQFDRHVAIVTELLKHDSAFRCLLSNHRLCGFNLPTFRYPCLISTSLTASEILARAHERRPATRVTSVSFLTCGATAARQCARLPNKGLGRRCRSSHHELPQ
jgi:hypothetical protein